MKFWLLIVLAIGAYVYKLKHSYQDAHSVSDEEIADSLKTGGGESPSPKIRTSGNLNQALRLFVDSSGERPTREVSSSSGASDFASEASQKTPEEFREAFSKLDPEDVQGRLANLYSFRGSTPQEKLSIRETLTHEFETQAKLNASSGQRAYLLEIQRIYLDHIEEPEEAEKNMQSWLREFPEDNQFQDALKANFLGRFPQFAASWEAQGLGISRDEGGQGHGDERMPASEEEAPPSEDDSAPAGE